MLIFKPVATSDERAEHSIGFHGGGSLAQKLGQHVGGSDLVLHRENDGGRVSVVRTVARELSGTGTTLGACRACTRPHEIPARTRTPLEGRQGGRNGGGSGREGAALGVGCVGFWRVGSRLRGRGRHRGTEGEGGGEGGVGEPNSVFLYPSPQRGQVVMEILPQATLEQSAQDIVVRHPRVRSAAFNGHDRLPRSGGVCPPGEN